MRGTFLAKTPAQLGAILRGYREEWKLTQKELAVRVGISQKAISLAETRPERMSLARLFQLLGVLEVELRLGRAARQAQSKGEW
jgi:HTH-type transcriptional regulator/antitoxin HipB